MYTTLSKIDDSIADAADVELANDACVNVKFETEPVLGTKSARVESALKAGETPAPALAATESVAKVGETLADAFDLDKGKEVA